MFIHPYVPSWAGIWVALRILGVAVAYWRYDDLCSSPVFGTTRYRVSSRSDRYTPFSWTHDSRDCCDVRGLGVDLVVLER